MATLLTNKPRFYNNDGTLASNGKLYTYYAGTTTQIATYSDAAGTIENTNPVTLDEKGEADIWVTGVIKINLLQSDLVQVTGYPIDNVNYPSVTMWTDRGNFDASVNTYPTTGGSGVSGAILTGDVWTISVVATGGSLNGELVGTTVRALTDTPAQVDANWEVLDVGLGASNAAAVAAAVSTAADAIATAADAVSTAADAVSTAADVVSTNADVVTCNNYAAAMNLNDTTDTSSSSVAIGTGEKTFTVTAGKSFVPSMFLVIGDAAAPSTNSMYCQVTSYSGTTLIVNCISFYGSGTKASWNISLTGAANQNATKLNSTEVTVTAHATTGDIFAAAGNSILWDDSGGPVTATIFPNAAQAGMVVECRCNAASSFTAGANLLIEGIPSGNTITLGSGAYFKVRAVTTTQFRMTYEYSGSFTITGTGFAVNPTATAEFKLNNGLVSLYVPASALTGTSNAATFTLTGLPASVVPTSGQVSPVFRATDNSANIMAIGTITGGANVITLYNVTGAGWTASNTKTLVSTLLQWTLD